ncbi:MAG: hypothetical protein AB2L14_09610 [Candidatus Xenobiia bacterium LiM19]
MPGRVEGMPLHITLIELVLSVCYNILAYIYIISEPIDTQAAHKPDAALYQEHLNHSAKESNSGGTLNQWIKIVFLRYTATDICRIE